MTDEERRQAELDIIRLADQHYGCTVERESMVSGDVRVAVALRDSAGRPVARATADDFLIAVGHALAKIERMRRAQS